MKTVLVAAALLCAMGLTPAHSKPKHVVLAPECNVSMPCECGFYSARAKRFIGVPFGAPLQHYIPKQTRRQIVPREPTVFHRASQRQVAGTVVHRQVAQVDRGAVIGSRPSGCPSRYCGCSASLYLFGKIIPALNLAANWLSFPRAMPAPRMAAARPGHVFVLVEHRGGSNWLVHDGNSGRGLTRLHVRNISGYTVVNPHA